MLGPVLYTLFSSKLPWNQMRNHPVLGAGCAAQQLVIMPVAYVYHILLADDETTSSSRREGTFSLPKFFLPSQTALPHGAWAVSGGND